MKLFYSSSGGEPERYPERVIADRRPHIMLSYWYFVKEDTGRTTRRLAALKKARR
jgi:hypothetical protein